MNFAILNGDPGPDKMKQLKLKLRNAVRAVKERL
jgi:hypothetical protein